MAEWGRQCAVGRSRVAPAPLPTFIRASGRCPVPLNMVSRRHWQRWHERFFAEHYDRLTSGDGNPVGGRDASGTFAPSCRCRAEVGRVPAPIWPTTEECAD